MQIPPFFWGFKAKPAFLLTDASELSQKKKIRPFKKKKNLGLSKI